ncbi:sensor histidine kinase [Herbaspirillum sp. NPDC101396]|uniref:sensor histidine kinase n=1 Tax=Herbaspirillum sp. NPDC101396 TaxID=3364005 RepID=UPI00383BDDCC
MSDTPAARPDPTAERIKEAERRRIAKDLHDELGSHLTALKMALARLGGQLPRDDTTLLEQARHADGLIDGALDAMHDIIDDLHPAVLDLGLQAALEWLARSFARDTGVPHRLHVDVPGDELPPVLLDAFQSVSLYRIAREALHNAGRHASARNVDISLRHDGKILTLIIADDGVGLSHDAGTRPQSSGLRGMHERAALTGGTLEVLQGDSGGTQLRLTLPVLSAANLIE